MINIHLNGDIIRCPDTQRIMERKKEREHAEGRCKHGIIEWKCEKWQQYVKDQKEVQPFSHFSRCVFDFNSECPMHKKKVELGSKKKNYKIDNVNYRKLSSAAHHLVKSSDYKTLFITLTFPKFKKQVNEKELNEYFSKYVENLRKNYKCRGYIAVRERGKINNRYHFHLLTSIPYVSFVKLNDVWCNTISDICYYSKNALTSDPKTLFIRNPGRALRYVCKYFAKGKGQQSDTRLIFMSNNLIKKPLKFYGSTEQILIGYKGIYISKTSDYTTAFRITNPVEFDKYCAEFLYDMFELPDKKTELYSFHPG